MTRERRNKRELGRTETICDTFLLFNFTLSLLTLNSPIFPPYNCFSLRIKNGTSRRLRSTQQITFHPRIYTNWELFSLNSVSSRNVHVCWVFVAKSKLCVASLLVLYTVTMTWPPPCDYNMCPSPFSASWNLNYVPQWCKQQYPPITRFTGYFVSYTKLAATIRVTRRFNTANTSASHRTRFWSIYIPTSYSYSSVLIVKAHSVFLLADPEETSTANLYIRVSSLPVSCPVDFNALYLAALLNKWPLKIKKFVI